MIYKIFGHKRGYRIWKEEGFNRYGFFIFFFFCLLVSETFYIMETNFLQKIVFFISDIFSLHIISAG